MRTVRPLPYTGAFPMSAAMSGTKVFCIIALYTVSALSAFHFVVR